MTKVVTEYCGYCEKTVEMFWDLEDGYKAFCPYCGKRLMLCDECLHPNDEYCDACDYDSQTDSCKQNRKEEK